MTEITDLADKHKPKVIDHIEEAALKRGRRRRQKRREEPAYYDAAFRAAERLAIEISAFAGS